MAMGSCGNLRPVSYIIKVATYTPHPRLPTYSQQQKHKKAIVLLTFDVQCFFSILFAIPVPTINLFQQTSFLFISLPVPRFIGNL